MRDSFRKLFIKSLGSYINVLAIVAPQKAGAKIFSLFTTPRKGKIGAHHTDFLHPARSEKLTFKNMELQAYVWQGKKDTILLVHGWESNTHRYKVLVERLQEEGYTIVAFDAPGHGYSDGLKLYVPLYADAVQLVKEKYRPRFIIGHSIGAMTAIYNQHNHPDDFVERMVVLGAPDKLQDMLAESEKLLGLSQKSMHAIDTYFKRRFGFTKKEFSSAAFAEAIQIPGLIIHDKEDSVTPAYGSEAIHDHWPQSSLILTKGLNHSLYSKDVDDLILRFLSGEKLPSKKIQIQETADV